MTSLSRTTLLTMWTLLLGFASLDVAQAQATASPIDARRLEVARRVMERVRYCALVSLASTGAPSARTVDPSAPDSDFVVRFVTNPRSRKLREIALHPDVTLYFFDASSQAYVSLYGRARIVREADAKRRYWKAEWTAHYPRRELDAAMVAVVPERIEVVSIADGVTGDSVTWAPPVVRIHQKGRR